MSDESKDTQRLLSPEPEHLEVEKTSEYDYGEEYTARPLPSKSKLPQLRNSCIVLAVIIAVCVELWRAFGAEHSNEHIYPADLSGSTASDKTVFETSATNLPPSLSELPPVYKHVTFISVWHANDHPQYLSNFLTSAASNAAVADFIVIHINDAGSDKCLDRFSEKDGFNTTWSWKNGGNIRMECLTSEEYMQHQLEYICGGNEWNCNAAQSSAVFARLRVRKQNIRHDWKQLEGPMFSRYFIRKPSETPLWGWLDMDTQLGDLQHLPFPLLATVGLMTFESHQPSFLFLGGEMAIFNSRSPGLRNAWRTHPSLSSADRFLQDEVEDVEGVLRHSIYLHKELSWAVAGDLHGEDDFKPGMKWAISSQAVLSLDEKLNRYEIETIVADANIEKPSEYSGWTTRGEVRTINIRDQKGCEASSPDIQWNLCYGQDEDTFGYADNSIRRPTIVKLGGDPLGQYQLRLEPDLRTRRWQQKLFLHYRNVVLDLPPYELDDSMVLELTRTKVMLWKKGRARERNVWSKFILGGHA